MTDSTAPTAPRFSCLASLVTGALRLPRAAHLPRPSGLVTGFASGHPPKGFVPGALFPFGVHRPASTIQVRVAARAAESII